VRYYNIYQYNIAPYTFGYVVGATYLAYNNMQMIAKRSLFAIVLCGFACCLRATETSSRPEDLAKRLPQESADAKKERLSWWTQSRFGMFIHFGLYALPARHEWVKMKERMPEDLYQRYFERFDPDLADPRDWARRAKAAGMKYVVLTTKHHEGFCLWDTKFTDYKITNTAFGRDLVKEYVEAVRAEGLKVGFYYSLIDWHHPDFSIDAAHPRRDGDDPEHKGIPALNVGKDMARYRQYMINQVTELLTQYGKIDIIWFDFSYPGKFGKGRDDWDSAAILSLARRLQPGIIVDNRLDLNDVPGGYDFVTPEQVRVEKWPEVDGHRVPWETCQTFSGSWGYHRDETSWKTPAQCLDLLIGTVAHGGNLIMNVGPTGRGEIDDRAVERLDAYARWMRKNARSIYGCTQAPEEFVVPSGAHLTYNPKTLRLYIHLMEYPAGAVGVRFGDKIDYAQFLHDASELKVDEVHDTKNDPNGYKHYIRVPVVKPGVEIPVIECFLK